MHNTTQHTKMLDLTNHSSDSIQAEAINSYMEVEEKLRQHSENLGVDQKVSLTPCSPIEHVEPAMEPSESVASTSSNSTGTVTKSSDNLYKGASVNTPIASRESATAAQAPATPAAPGAKSGRWSLDEKLMFLYGLSLFGKGRWKRIHAYVPDRSLVQIKSHAQKVMKHLGAGENVFRQLSENRERLRILVAAANERIRQMEEENAKHKGRHQSTLDKKKNKRKRASTRKHPCPLSRAAIDFDTLHDQDVDWAIDCAIRSSPNHFERLRPVSGTNSPIPSLIGDSPAICSSQLSSAHGTPMCSSPPLEMATRVGSDETGGSGAVIAAVAALCQLSSERTNRSG